MDSFNGWCQKEKVIFVMGATGTGKSKLSIDLATQFPAEIINSDKMQVYKGLDIVTNKITEEDRCGVPHHVLGVVDPNAKFTVYDFRYLVSLAVESILGRNRIPIIVGGSNSYIKALVDDEEHDFRSKYECCFLWVDVALPVLYPYLSYRVDQMVEAGLVKELREFFEPKADYNRGIRSAIGVPEMDQYLRAEIITDTDEKTLKMLLETSINDIKTNTCQLACRQLQKILHLENLPEWTDMHHIDATKVFQKRGREADEVWEELVACPCKTIVKKFLYSSITNNTNPLTSKSLANSTPFSITSAAMNTIVLTATH
ncbi:hypothetical protein GIB67_041470 [Kingdonia uniflora]|uniref:adenylate dimethylallyltransferase (ADP/ATP-dependent) n=1 Tax=Kingdonia uniflora TaxID=39325 RepID=A0A7J7LRK2_9MAGN|nr:hypothetical protein GIB67_041470 [Kingdonia uniflora]